MKERINRLLAKMREGTYEREEVLALSLLSALAGESIFLLGLPGVGKSMVARRLKLAFKDASVFEYLMSRFSTPDEIFGPVSISKLKDSDSYERVTRGYLPDAEIVFLDEIWKAGPAIQNSLLTVLNEKIFLNGNRELRLPLQGLISASNELPAEGEGLEALWDRFLLRYVVEPLKLRTSFVRLISSSPVGPRAVEEPFDAAECETLLQQSRQIRVPEPIIDLLCTIRGRMSEKAQPRKDDDKEENEEKEDPAKFYISDRRWKKAVGILRMSALLNDRREVNLSDTLLLSHMLWNDDPMIATVDSLLAEEIVRQLFRDLLDRLKNFKRQRGQQPPDHSLYKEKGTFYVVMCDGDNLRLRIRDYEMLRKAKVMYFGSEMSDGTIAVGHAGQFSLQVAKEGTVIINGYSYPLRTNADKLSSKNFLDEFSGQLNALADGLRDEMAANIFVNQSLLQKEVLENIVQYRKRIEDS